jgi:hypothetical protein
MSPSRACVLTRAANPEIGFCWIAAAAAALRKKGGSALLPRTSGPGRGRQARRLCDTRWSRMFAACSRRSGSSRTADCARCQKRKRNPIVGSKLLRLRKPKANPPFTCENIVRNTRPTSGQSANRRRQRPHRTCRRIARARGRSRAQDRSQCRSRNSGCDGSSRPLRPP